MVHIAIIGTGKVGSALAYTLAFEPYVDKITLVDVIPKLSLMIKEDIYHGISLGSAEIHIESFEDCRMVKDADIIVISAGYPRTPGMSRRDLANKNANIIKEIVLTLKPNNHGAWYIIITNPVDPLATLAQRLLGEDGKVIGTGTCLEAARFKYILSRKLSLPINAIEAYVGGEHGEEAVLLWSMVRINDKPLKQYLKESSVSLHRSEIEEYVKGISVEIIKAQGATIWGPARAFLEIIRTIVLNTGRILCFSTPRKFEGLPSEVFVSIPTKLGRSIGPDLWHYLSSDEQEAIKRAAVAIFNIYRNISFD